MRAIASISVLVMAVAMSMLAASDDAHASPEDDARLRAAIAGPEKPKDIEEVVRLLDKGANPNVRDEFGRTAVHYAAGGTTGIHGTGATLNLLLARGGDCCYKDFQGDTPLHFAVAAANDPLSDDADVEGRIRSLLGNGADPNEPNRRGYTPFHFSAKSSDSFHDTVIINSLLQAGADPDAVAGDGNTPLHLAAGVPVILDSGHGHHFLSMGWDAGEHILTDDGIPGNDADIVDALLAGGANPNVVNDAGMTPLLVVLTIDGVSTLAVEAAVKSLLSAGADPNATRRDGLPPLHIVLNYPESRSTLARRMTQEGIALVEALLGAGADPDAKNQQGDTPLHVAVRHEWGEDMVEALLAGSADPCIRNHEERWVPEQLARGLGQKDVNLALQLGGGYEDDCEKGEEAKLGLDRDARRRIQSCLKTQGFDPGTPDGLFGPRTRGAISAWQEAQGDDGEASGYLTQDQFDALTAACKSAAPTPLCTDGTDTPCWMETANQPGCHIWNRYPAPEETVTWSGACVDGKASGKGEVVWRLREDEVWRRGSSGHGEKREGKSVGHWVIHTPSREVWQGSYVDGELHGRWVRRGSRGEHWECRNHGERVHKNHPLCATEAADDKMQVTKGITLRSGPTDDYEEIGRLAIEDEVTVTRKARRWAWVETASGQQGFAPLSALEELKEPKVAAVVTEPKCASGYDSQCWVELSNRSGCFFFFDYSFSSLDELSAVVVRGAQSMTSAHWSGECIEGVATGDGIMTTITNLLTQDNEQQVRWHGTLSRGKWEGRCQIESYRDVVSTYEYVHAVEMHYKEGTAHGPIAWTERVTGPGDDRSTSGKGLFHEGKAHGRWHMEGWFQDENFNTVVIYDNGKFVDQE